MKRYLINAVLIMFAFSIIAGRLDAQVKSKEPGLLHSPIKADQLPFPGSPMIISVTLENTKNSTLILKGFFTRDGKLIEQNLTDFSTDNSDRVVYSTTLNAPLAELNYQFVLMDGPNMIASSKRYALRRPCIPNIEPIEAKLPENTPMKNKVRLLQIQATSIQNEVTNYETAFKLLDELKTLTEK